MSADLQVARVYYTTLGDEAARRETAKALQRAEPFLRRQIAARVRLRRVPELQFTFDESVQRGERIEQLLQEIKRRSAPGRRRPAPMTTPTPSDRKARGPRAHLRRDAAAAGDS